MSRMGGSCSLQRQRALWQQHRQNSRGAGGGGGPGSGRNSGGGRSADARRSVRHTVDSEVPDGSISALYPPEDNYITTLHTNKRSPKSLTNLCIEAVCRSLPNLDGELPPGLPQDIVDAIVKSLMQHAALNATTLRALRHCELGELSLAGCRGVSDDWLVPLSCGSGSSASSSPSFGPAYHGPDEEFVDPMDLDHTAYSTEGGQCYGSLSHHHGVVGNPVSSSVIYRNDEEEEESSSCSTSSFVSASSTPFLPVQGSNSADHNDIFASPRATARTTTSHFEDMVSSPTQSIPDLSSQMYGGGAGSPALLPSLTSNLTLLDLRGSQRLTDRGLMQLTNLSSLTVAKLDNCHAIVGRGLTVFASSHRLHTLSLANCRRLTDEAVLNISHLTSIEALALDGCRCLTDRSLESISNLFGLRKLDMSQCDLITDDGLNHLRDLPYIEELSLGWCRSVTDHGIEILASQQSRKENLRVLRLARCPITDDGIYHVGIGFPSLEELDLNGCSNVGSAALGMTLERLGSLCSLDASYCPGILRVSWQGKIKSLKSLELCYSGVRDAHLSRLTSLPALEELNLDSCPVGDWAISHLADNDVVPNLSALDLADTDLTDLGMVHLPKFERLTRLSLFYCNITNAGLQHLSSMTSLEVLNLDSREIGDDGLSHLRPLTHLRSLDIFSGRITDMGCSHISKIKSLESLELCGGGVGDLGCAHLAGNLENLTSLNLSQNERITNRGAASLAALSNLKALNLSNTRVNSAALRFLGGLLKLQSLALYGCRGIEDGDAGIDVLQSELPSLKCLRLNSTCDNDDGIIVESNLDDDDDDEREVDDERQRGDDEGGIVVPVAGRLHRGRQSDSDDDDDSVGSLASSRRGGGGSLDDDNDEQFAVGEENHHDDDGSAIIGVGESDDDDDDSLRLDEMDVAADEEEGGGGVVVGPQGDDDDDVSIYSDHD